MRISTRILINACFLLVAPLLVAQGFFFSQNGARNGTTLTGWDDSSSNWTQCFKPGCNPGGSGTPSSVTQTFATSSPSLDGNAMLLSVTGPAFSDVLFGRHIGAQNTATNFLLDMWFYLDGTSGNFQALEFDIHQSISGTQWQFGTECNHGGFWQVWNSSTWLNTSLACSISTLTWHHLQLSVHRIQGDTSACSGQPCMYYDNLTLDASPFAIGMVEPATSTANADDVGIDVQLDINGSGGTLTEYNDLVGITYGN